LLLCLVNEAASPASGTVGLRQNRVGGASGAGIRPKPNIAVTNRKVTNS
jgi:hypothetical protein